MKLKPTAGISLSDARKYLTQGELAEFEALVVDREGNQGLADFIEERFPREPPPHHLMPLIDVLERARHERVRLCLSVPPRHGKTVTILRAMVWWLIHEPRDSCAYYSYSDHQAWSKSRICRKWARQCNVGLSKENSSVGEWETTEGGVCYFGGLDSGLTGKGVSGLFIVDDPFKNRMEADSLTIRERRWESFNEVVFTRLEGASVIVVHTRWHQDDLIGRLEGDDRWEYLNLQATSEGDGDLLGRPVGEALWPSKFNEEELEDIRTQLGEWSYAALYQGQPRPRGNAVFIEPGRFRMPATPAEWASFLQGKKICIAVDPAASERTQADYSVAIVMVKDGMGAESTTWIIDVIRRQLSVPAFVSVLRDLQRRWKAKVVVEAVGGFKAVPQMLKHVDPSLRVIEVTPTTDKFQRAQGVAAAWNDGRVLVPVGDGANVAWVDDFLAEVLSFTGVKDAHDDQVDALAHGWNAMYQTKKPVKRGARRARELPFG